MTTINAGNFGTGASGQVLTSNGTGVAPSFQGVYSLSPFIVGPDVNSQYTTIQTAITAAVSAGASNTNQKNVYIKPGTYAENLTGAPGVNLIGLSSEINCGADNDSGNMPNLSVIWTGSCSLATGTMIFQNIRILNTTVTNIFTSSGTFKAIFQNCQFADNSSNNPIFFNGVNIDVSFNNCSFIARNLVKSTGAGNLNINITDSFIAGDITTDSSIRIGILRSTFTQRSAGITTSSIVIMSATYCNISSGIVSTSPYTNQLNLQSCVISVNINSWTWQQANVTANNCNITAGVPLINDSAGSGNGTYNFRNCVMQCATLGSYSGLLSIFGGSLQGSSAPTFTGAGAVNYIGCSDFGSTTGSITSFGLLSNATALDPASTDGFLYLPSLPGAPTGTPITYGAGVPLVYDTTDSKLFTYNGSWQEIGGYYSITPFIVGTDTHSQYSTIQAAITAAIAAGASDTTPLNIYIKPGTYSETLTAAPGIRLIGLCNHDVSGKIKNNVIWTGTCTWASGNVTFENMQLLALGSSSKMITLPDSSRLTLTNCQIYDTDGTSDYFYTPGTTSLTYLVLNNCYGEAPTAFLLTDNGSSTQFLVNNSNLTMPMSIDGYMALVAENSYFTGMCTVTSNGQTQLQYNFCTGTVGLNGTATTKTNDIIISYCDFNLLGFSFQAGSMTFSYLKGACLFSPMFDNTSGAGGNNLTLNQCTINGSMGSLATNTALHLNGGDYSACTAPTLAAGASVVAQDALLFGSSVVTRTASLSAIATDGFLYIPTCIGIPTGTPSTYGDSVAMVYDTTTNGLYIYASGLWRLI